MADSLERRNPIIPSQFDLLLLDLKSKHLHEDIAGQLKVRYLDAIENIPSLDEPLNGIVWGPAKRFCVSAVVSFKKKNRTLIFVVDEITNPERDVHVKINGRKTSVWLSPHESHFNDVNLLGTDFMSFYHTVLHINYDEYTGYIKIMEEDE